MTNNESERELVLQTLRTWMAFRQAVQRGTQTSQRGYDLRDAASNELPVEQTRHQPAIPG